MIPVPHSHETTVFYTPEFTRYAPALTLMTKPPPLLAHMCLQIALDSKHLLLSGPLTLSSQSSKMALTPHKRYAMSLILQVQHKEPDDPLHSLPHPQC